MAQNVTPLNGMPFSSAELRKHIKRGPFFNYLDKRLSFADKAFIFDDFDQRTLNADYWFATTGANATIAAIFLPGGTTMAGLGHGFIRMCGTSAGAFQSGASILSGALEYFGTQNAAIEIRFRQAGTTSNTAQFEFGFADAAGTTAQISDIDTPAANATVCALFAVDPSQTLTSAAFITKGAASTTSVTGMSIKATTLPFIAGMCPTSSATTVATDCRLNPGTFCTIRIELRGSSAFCHVNGQLAAQHNTPSASATAGNRGGYIAATRALVPWLTVRDVADGGFSELHVDYIAVWQDRVGGG